jgi:cell division protein FtsB
MDVFTMVVIIVAIACGAGAYNNYLKTRRQEAQSAPAEDVRAELDSLRARVETLEKIVTDEKYQLHRALNELESSA